jgi:hypothetical protein
MSRRKAKLRKEYADWYPLLAAGEWHDAAWTAEQVLRQMRRASPRWQLGDRILDPRHFEFYGGVHGRPSRAERRQSVPVLLPAFHLAR